MPCSTFSETANNAEYFQRYLLQELYGSVSRQIASSVANQVFVCFALCMLRNSCANPINIYALSSLFYCIRPGVYFRMYDSVEDI